MQQMRFVLIDIDTQKDYVEHFGAAAIPDCPVIRENLMELMSFAIRNKLPILSLIRSENDGEICKKNSPEWEKVLDTECEKQVWISESLQELQSLSKEPTDWQQILLEHSGDKPSEVNGLEQTLAQLEPTHLIVFGVPLESTVIAILDLLLKNTTYKIWLVRDAVKGYQDENATLEQLRGRENLSLMSARNVLKFLSELRY